MSPARPHRRRVIALAASWVALSASSCSHYSFAAPADDAQPPEEGAPVVYVATMNAPATHQLPLPSLTLALVDQLQRCGASAVTWDGAPGRASSPIVRCGAEHLKTRGMGDLLVTEARVSCILTDDARTETVSRTGRAELIRDPASTTIALTREVETLAMLRAIADIACPVRATLTDAP